MAGESSAIVSTKLKRKGKDDEFIKNAEEIASVLKELLESNLQGYSGEYEVLSRIASLVLVLSMSYPVTGTIEALLKDPAKLGSLLQVIYDNATSAPRPEFLFSASMLLIKIIKDINLYRKIHNINLYRPDKLEKMRCLFAQPFNTLEMHELALLETATEENQKFSKEIAKYSKNTLSFIEIFKTVSVFVIPLSFLLLLLFDPEGGLVLLTMFLANVGVLLFSQEVAKFSLHFLNRNYCSYHQSKCLQEKSANFFKKNLFHVLKNFTHDSSFIVKNTEFLLILNCKSRYISGETLAKEICYLLSLCGIQAYFSQGDSKIVLHIMSATIFNNLSLETKSNDYNFNWLLQDLNKRLTVLEELEKVGGVECLVNGLQNKFQDVTWHSSFFNDNENNLYICFSPQFVKDDNEDVIKKIKAFCEEKGLKYCTDEGELHPYILTNEFKNFPQGKSSQRAVVRKGSVISTGDYAAQAYTANPFQQMNKKRRQKKNSAKEKNAWDDKRDEKQKEGTPSGNIPRSPKAPLESVVLLALRDGLRIPVFNSQHLFFHFSPQEMQRAREDLLEYTEADAKMFSIIQMGRCVSEANKGQQALKVSRMRDKPESKVKQQSKNQELEGKSKKQSKSKESKKESGDADAKEKYYRVKVKPKGHFGYLRCIFFSKERHEVTNGAKGEIEMAFSHSYCK